MTHQEAPEAAAPAAAFHHDPVMAQEVLGSLNLRKGDAAVDATLGGGGHAALILQATAPDGALYGIDRDADAIGAARERLAEFGGRARILRGRMGEIAELLAAEGAAPVRGILADLGVSSFQLDCGERGFSLRSDAPLDMRMDRTAGEGAAEWLADADEEEIARVLREYGEERYARRIARSLSRNRGIATTGQLAAAVVAAMPPPARRGRIHPATRTFQALRIAVNDELGELSRFLDAAPGLLSPGGRMVVISYHSLEDRLVKRAFRALADGGAYALPVRRAQRPTEAEVERNPRARSAKLRVLERR